MIAEVDAKLTSMVFLHAPLVRYLVERVSEGDRGDTQKRARSGEDDRLDDGYGGSTVYLSR